MKYVAILFALAVACLLAVPALSAVDGKGPAEGCGQFCGSCQCSNGEALGAQNQYGQDNTDCQGAGICARDGSCDGTGPKRDGSCKAV